MPADEAHKGMGGAMACTTPRQSSVEGAGKDIYNGLKSPAHRRATPS
jgi:hypothetical protein